MRFRWEWLWVPAVCLVVFWVLSTVNPACAWTDVMDAMGVTRRDAYMRTACLATGLVAIVAILRVLRRHGDKD